MAVALGGCSSKTSGQNTAGRTALKIRGQTEQNKYAIIGGETDNGVGIRRIEYGQPSASPTRDFFYKMARALTGRITATADTVPLQSADLFLNLPSNIKRVIACSQYSLVYIADTDKKDHGAQVVMENLLEKTKRTIYEARDGYKIDDMVAPAGCEKIALWEVKFAEGSEILLGGYSKVTLVDPVSLAYQTALGPQKTGVLSGADRARELEKLSDNACMQYPYSVFVDENKLETTILLDTFCPNAGGVWAAGGYTASSAAPASKHPLLKAGSYSSVPAVSSDGRIAVVVRPGQPYSEDLNGVLSARENHGSINVINLENNAEMEALKLTAGEFVGGGIAVSEDGHYAAVVIYPDIDRGLEEKNGKIFLIDLRTRIKREIKLEDGFLPIEFTENDLVLGKPSNISFVQKPGDEYRPISTLGGKYSLLYSEIIMYNLASGGSTKGSLPQLAQYILGMWKIDWNNLTPIERDQLVIDYVEIRTFPNRDKQQQAPTGFGGITSKLNCKQRMALNTGVLCAGSPLYLYSDKEIEVGIKPENDVFNAVPEISDGRWTVRVKDNGKIIDKNGGSYPNIKYDYQVEAKAPASGVLASQATLEEELSQYADNLGLNKVEKADFVLTWYEKLKSAAPYVQISHFPLRDSARLVDLKITPKPDNYYPIVMYFRPLYLPIEMTPPTYETITDRGGFTAVDWSGVIGP